ncbi:MAG: hypothetical protein P1P77_07030 [Spirochaetaceae bacterium]|nr:hypothetical protein [Spirochaetaceae bacterium]
MIRFVFRFTVILLLFSLIGCAGSPRESETAAYDEPAEAPSIQSEINETVEPDEPPVKKSAANNKKKKPGTPESPESPEPSVTPQSEELSDDNRETAASPEITQISPLEIEDRDVVVPTDPPSETKAEASTDSVSETLSPSPSPSPSANPLLTEDRPYSDDATAPSTPPQIVSSSLSPRELPRPPDAEVESAMSEEQDPAPRIDETPSREAENIPMRPFEDPEKAAAAPSRILDGPGEFSVVLDGPGWVFRSDLSTPGAWRFLGRERDGESTRFRFLFDRTGRWEMVFERQDLSSGGSERATRSVVVGEDGGPSVSLGPLPQGEETAIPGTLPESPHERYLAAENAVDQGRIGEAIELWEQDASRGDAEGKRARSAIMFHAAGAGAVGPLINWLPQYLSDGPDPEVLSATLEVFENQAGYLEQKIDILETLLGMKEEGNRAEWLYRLANYLEQPGEGRNLDRAAALYGEVIEEWPLTVWRDLSEERLNWLKRYYFRIR